MVETVYMIPNAPRIALLTDLHNRPAEKIIRSLHAHSPNLICIAGDIIYGSWPKDDVSPLVSQTNVISFLEACADIAPTYLSLGNHEWMLIEDDIKAIRGTGVTVLDNSWIDTGRDNVIIGGLTSVAATNYRRIRAAMAESGELPCRYPRRSLMDETAGLTARHGRHERHFPDIDWSKDYVTTPGYHVLLSHHSEYFDLINSRIEVILSGHSHGGQWNYWSPKTRRWEGVFAPGQGLFPKYTSGIYEKKSEVDGSVVSRMVVSRGLANTAPVPRLFNPTEIVYIEPA